MDADTDLHTQEKCFTRWANTFLLDRRIQIEDIESEIRDGVALLQLLEILSDQKITTKYEKKPRSATQRQENLLTVVQFMQEQKMEISPALVEDICDGHLEEILELFRHLILHYQLYASSYEEARQELLSWVNKTVPQHEIQDFTTSWQDGTLLLQLVNTLQQSTYHEDLDIDVDELNNNPESYLIVAFDKADDLLRTPPLLDPSDVLENPDEWSMMTYISYLRNFVEDITLHSSPSPPGLLNITVHEAEELPILKNTGPNAYVLVELIDKNGKIKETWKTSIQKHQTRPVWDHTFKTEFLPEQYEELRFQCFHHNSAFLGKDRFLGEVRIEASMCAFSNNWNSYPLLDKPKDGAPAVDPRQGKLSIELNYHSNERVAKRAKDPAVLKMAAFKLPPMEYVSIKFRGICEAILAPDAPAEEGTFVVTRNYLCFVPSSDHNDGLSLKRRDLRKIEQNSEGFPWIFITRDQSIYLQQFPEERSKKLLRVLKRDMAKSKLRRHNSSERLLRRINLKRANSYGSVLSTIDARDNDTRSPDRPSLGEPARSSRRADLRHLIQNSGEAFRSALDVTSYQLGPKKKRKPATVGFSATRKLSSTRSSSQSLFLDPEEVPPPKPQELRMEQDEDEDEEVSSSLSPRPVVDASAPKVGFDAETKFRDTEPTWTADTTQDDYRGISDEEADEMKWEEKQEELNRKLKTRMEPLHTLSSGSVESCHSPDLIEAKVDRSEHSSATTTPEHHSNSALNKPLVEDEVSLSKQPGGPPRIPFGLVLFIYAGIPLIILLLLKLMYY